VPVRERCPRILVDAPCSGLGTLRRHPEIRWRMTPRQLGRLAAVQSQILERVSAALAPGGFLLYVTCSTEPEENEQVVEGVLQRDAGLDPVRLAPTGPASALVGEDGALRTWPLAPELDGFYAALLRRHGDGGHGSA
jgi:16S rRNA (cytosine967-C5)-methyltransferase